MRRRNIVTIRVLPWARAHSSNAEWSGFRYFVWRIANPPTTAIRRNVKILDSGIPPIISGAAFENHFSSISRAVKSMTKSHTHCMLGYSSSFFAIHQEAATMSMIDTISPMRRFTTFPWLAPATARTLSRLIATSAMMIVCIAVLKVVAVFHHPCSSCSFARISL